MMSTQVFVDPESSTSANGTQSSRVPVPLPEDPYEAVRHAYFDGMDTKSEPFENLINTETLESPLAIAPPIPLSGSTPPVLVPILHMIARMAVRVPYAMSLGLYASMAGVAAMSESALRKRFQSSYESSPSVSPPDLPFKDAEDEGPTAKDEDPATEDEGLTAAVEGPGMDDEGYGLDDESRGIDNEGHSIESDGLGLGYGALRLYELALEEGNVYSTFEVGQGSGSAPESGRPERVSAFRQPTLTTWTNPEDGIIYIDIPDYPPSAPPVQTPPSAE
ncbi:hypothetical protein Tco_1311010 [Tanacetum coccineum]